MTSALGGGRGWGGAKETSIWAKAIGRGEGGRHLFILDTCLVSSTGESSRSAHAMACCPLSVRPSVVRRPSVHPALAFSIFDISSRTISWIELKLSVRHCGNM